MTRDKPPDWRPPKEPDREPAREIEPEAPLSETQELLMAYVDDEMDPEQRADFQQRLADEPELAAEAAEFQELMDVHRTMAVIEPTEQEMRLGWVLLMSGLVVLLAEGIYLLVASSVGWHVKGAALSVLLGGAVLLLNTIRLKIRTSRFDRYRGVMR